MSSALQQLERMRADLGRLIEQAAQEAPAFEDGRAYHAGRQSMRDDVLALLSARALELGQARQGREAGALLRAAVTIEGMA